MMIWTFIYIEQKNVKHYHLSMPTMAIAAGLRMLPDSHEISKYLAYRTSGANQITRMRHSNFNSQEKKKMPAYTIPCLNALLNMRRKLLRLRCSGF